MPGGFLHLRHYALRFFVVRKLVGDHLVQIVRRMPLGIKLASDAAKGDLAVNMRDAWQFTRQLAERCKYNKPSGAGCGLDATPVRYCNCSFSHSTTFAR